MNEVDRPKRPSLFEMAKVAIEGANLVSLVASAAPVVAGVALTILTFVIGGGAIKLLTGAARTTEGDWLISPDRFSQISYFIAGSMAAAITLTFVAVIYFRAYQKQKSQAKAEKAAFEAKEKTAMEREALVAERLAISRANSIDFKSISQHNAAFDRDIFNGCFVQIYNSCKDPHVGQLYRDQMRPAVRDITNNIVQNLDFLKGIADRISGQPCFTNIKILDSSVGSVDAQRMLTRTVHRDQDSAAHRKKNRDQLVTRADEDSSHLFVLTNPGEIFASNNLRDDPEYRNGRNGWNKLYNSVAICGIDNFDRSNDSITIQGLLTIDSENGELDDEFIKAHLEEFSNRIAVLLYRAAIMTRYLEGN